MAGQANFVKQLSVAPITIHDTANMTDISVREVSIAVTFADTQEHQQREIEYV